jgi:hypothetical protein
VLSRMYRTLRLPIATMALVLTIFALSSAPASAHSTIVEHGEDYAVTDSGHSSGAVCDWERDGHIVVAYWYDNDGGKIAYAEVGGAGSCNDVSWKGEADTVRVCEIGKGCTGFHKV